MPRGSRGKADAIGQDSGVEVGRSPLTRPRWVIIRPLACGQNSFGVFEPEWVVRARLAGHDHHVIAKGDVDTGVWT